MKQKYIKGLAVGFICYLFVCFEGQLESSFDSRNLMELLEGSITLRMKKMALSPV